MLREAFEIQVQAEGNFPSSAWWSIDAEIINSLSKYTTHITDRVKLGELYSTLFTLWIDTSSDELRGLEKLNSTLNLFSYRLAEDIDHRIRVHIILDNGTFERSMKVFLVDNSRYEVFGATSRSVIISLHSQSNSNNHPAKEKLERALVANLADCFDVKPERIKNSILNTKIHDQFSAHTLLERKQPSLWGLTEPI